MMVCSRFELTSAKVNDITAARRMLIIAARATYVFDFAYYDFGWWAELAEVPAAKPLE